MRSVKQLLEGKPAGVVAVDADDPVLTAIQAMADHHIGAVLVLRGGKLAGILSERDYARKVILKGRSSAETATWEIMSSPVVGVGLDDTLDSCMRLMTERRFRHLPVLDGGELIGVLSIGDLVKAVIEEQQQEIAQLQHYIVSG